jgi:hypothetical protein
VEEERTRKVNQLTVSSHFVRCRFFQAVSIITAYRQALSCNFFVGIEIFLRGQWFLPLLNNGEKQCFGERGTLLSALTVFWGLFSH